MTTGTNICASAEIVASVFFEGAFQIGNSAHGARQARRESPRSIAFRFLRSLLGQSPEIEPPADDEFAPHEGSRLRAEDSQ